MNAMDDWKNPDGTGLILGPDDHTIFGLAWNGCLTETGPDGIPTLVAAGGEGWLRLTLPPQHTAESPVRWGFWDNQLPRVGEGFPEMMPPAMPPRGALTFEDEAYYRHGPAAVDHSGTAFLSWPTELLSGRRFPPGASLARTHGGVFAIDLDGVLCRWQALDGWSSVAAAGATHGLQPGGHVVAIDLPNGRPAIFFHLADGIACWVEDLGTLGGAALTVDPGAHFAPAGGGEVGVVTAKNRRIYKAVLHPDGSTWRWSVGYSGWHPELPDGAPLATVSVDWLGMNVVACNTSQQLVMMNWEQGFSRVLGSGFPPGAAVAATPDSSPGSGLFWAFAIDVNGVLRAVRMASVEGQQYLEKVGDWFPPGSPIAAKDIGGGPLVFAVGADNTLRHAEHRLGQWSSADSSLGWSPLMTMPPQPAQHSGPSHLQIRLPRGERISLSVAGIRAAFDQTDLFPALMTARQACQIEMPWGLWLSPRAQTRAVSTTAATAPDGTTAIWQARLIQRADAAGDLKPLELRADLARKDTDFDQTLGNRPALDQTTREDIVQLAGSVTARRAILSSAGGWLSADADWTQGSWEQEIATGRDIRVRVVRQGHLLPFGHAATYVEATERRFDPRADRSTAVLHQTGTLYVNTPVRLFKKEDSPKWRAFPFRRVELTPTAVTNLDAPGWAGESGARRFWPTIDGRRVEFTFTLAGAERDITMSMPLLFTESASVDAITEAQTLLERVELGEAAVQLAGDEVFDVRSLSLAITATASTDTPLEVQPRITGAEVNLPAVVALTGKPASSHVTFADSYLEHGRLEHVFDLRQNLDLRFQRSERCGGVATPSFVADGVSAMGGPIKANALEKIDPTTFFGTIPAKLLGILNLRDVLDEAADIAPPDIESIAKPGFPSPRTSMKWRGVRLGETGPFRPNGTSELSLTVETFADDPAGPPRSHTEGEITNFTLGLAGVLDARFDKLRFVADSGRKPSIEIDGFDLTFGGDLRFLDVLLDAVAEVTGDPPLAVDAGPDGVVVSRSLGLPEMSLGAGVFAVTLSGATFHTQLRLPYSDALSLDFSFGTRKQPFLLGVWILGGGGYLELEIRNGKLASVIAGVEVGGLWSFDWFVVAGEVHALAGIRLELIGEDVLLAGYLRVGGTVEVLGLISVGIELAAEITAGTRDDRWQVTAAARLALEVDLFLTTAEVNLEKEVVIYRDGPDRSGGLRDPGPDTQHDVESPFLTGLATPAGREPPLDDVEQAWAAYAAAFTHRSA